jgi:hypothetical protein
LHRRDSQQTHFAAETLVCRPSRQQNNSKSFADTWLLFAVIDERIERNCDSERGTGCRFGATYNYYHGIAAIFGSVRHLPVTRQPK